MYRRLIIYYLSGTGNALIAARWFADLARERGMRCLNICPRKAIQVSHVFTAVTAYILYGLLFPLVMSFVAQFLPSTTAVMASEIRFIGIIRAWAILSVMFLAYRLVQALARFRPVNYFFAGLSLTRLLLWRRYLAPGVTLRDFKRDERVSF